MIKAEVSWTKQNVWDFVMESTIGGKGTKIMFASYIICFAVVIVAAIVTFAVTMEPVVMIIGGAAALLMAVYVAVFALILRGTAKKILEANKSDLILTVVPTEEDIEILSNGMPYGVIGWDKVEKIMLRKKASYIITKDNALVILEYARLSEGTKDELTALLKEKNDKLSKAA